MILSIAVLAFLVWFYLAGLRGMFWRSIPVLEAGTPQELPYVAVLVPARNEAETIHASLSSLLSQDYAGRLTVILIDDNSTDETAKIAGTLGCGDGLQIITGLPLPPGWSGKLWALHQGLQHAASQTAEYILLTDADIVHAPGHVSALIAKAQAGRFDLVSEMVRLHCLTAAERGLIPAFVFFFQMLYPFAWVADPRRKTAAAAGGTILVSRAALAQIGGVSVIRGKLIDDCALAGRIKAAGGKLWLGHSQLAASIRVYAGWNDIWNMVARTAYEQLGYSWLLLAGCVTAMSVIFIAPPVLAAATLGWARLLGVLTWLAMAAVFQPTLRRYGRSPLWGFALPGIALFYLCATVASGLRHRAGRGGGWKSRVYPDGAGQ